MPTPLHHHPRRLVTSVMAVCLMAGSALVGPASAANPDTDQDGLPDWYERDRTLTSLTKADTDGDGIADGAEDLDGDRLRNLTELRATTHPRVADSDGDGVRDDREDVDVDRLLNVEEQAYKTDPRVADTDNDGWRDAAEVRAGTDPTSAASHPSVVGVPPWVPGAEPCPIFPAGNVWNVRIDGRSVASNSATMIKAIGLDRGLHMDFGSYLGYGIPFQVVNASTPRSTVTFDYDDESDHVGYPIGSAPKIEGGSDRHILMVDRDYCRLYELFAARKSGGRWYAGSGAVWDLRSNALRPDGWTSADAAGLPILPGLVRYDEVAAGAILHALRFTTNQTRSSHIYPARHDASDSSSTSLPPMGLRVRLKGGYSTAGFSPQARVIAEALKRYGMILADNGSPWYITGASDVHFDDDVMHELDVITGRDLEVVDTTGLVNGT
jgi:hypothetical protein